MTLSESTQDGVPQKRGPVGQSCAVAGRRVLLEPGARAGPGRKGAERDLSSEKETAHPVKLWGGAKNQHGQSPWAGLGLQGERSPRQDVVGTGCGGVLEVVVERHRSEKHREVKSAAGAGRQGSRTSGP